MADDRWLYKLLGIEEEDGDEDLREAGIPPALLFMRGLMRQGQGGGGDMKQRLAQVLSGAGNVATQVGRGAQDLGAFGAQRAQMADQAFAQGLAPIGSALGALPGIAQNTPLFANPVAQQAFGQAVGDVGQAITGVGQFFEPSPIVQLTRLAMRGGQQPTFPSNPNAPPGISQVFSKVMPAGKPSPIRPTSAPKPKSPSSQPGRRPSKSYTPKRPSRGPLAGGR